MTSREWQWSLVNEILFFDGGNDDSATRAAQVFGFRVLLWVHGPLLHTSYECASENVICVKGRHVPWFSDHFQTSAVFLKMQPQSCVNMLDFENIR